MVTLGVEGDNEAFDDVDVADAGGVSDSLVCFVGESIVNSAVAGVAVVGEEFDEGDIDDVDVDAAGCEEYEKLRVGVEVFDVVDVAVVAVVAVVDVDVVVAVDWVLSIDVLFESGGEGADTAVETPLSPILSFSLPLMSLLLSPSCC